MALRQQASGALLPARIECAARDLAARLRSRFGERACAISVFGSQARGEGREDSDLDVFVRIAGLTERERAELFELAGAVSIDHLVCVQTLAPAPAEYEWLDRNECALLRDIREHGIPL
jgi:predicted nucleotidyltransferase